MSTGAQTIRAKEPALASRMVVVASADVGLRQRLKQCLMGLRWTVHEASGGAEAMGLIEQQHPEALLVDSWLPDLEAGEFAAQLGKMYPGMDLLQMDGGMGRGSTGVRSPRRHELLHAIREAQEAGVPVEPAQPKPVARSLPVEELPLAEIETRSFGAPAEEPVMPPAPPPRQVAIAEMIGESRVMLELARMIRLVAPRSATVLIEGETGTGKEVVAKALHRLSTRAGKPFAVLNCAAIPESLLEAELFGHTRGAFTGAVQSRTGRIEAAHGGTLFLDEIGEMPLALQAKMLRFLEYGEIQRVGDNETMRVDVRVIAATHQHLQQRAEERTFRLDLYHRLSVFPLEVPPLRERMEDLPLLVEFFLEQMGREMPKKSITAESLEKLRDYDWPGNVRELMHVLTRGSIHAEERPEIAAGDIELRRRSR